MDTRNIWLGVCSILLGTGVIVYSGQLDAVPAFFPRVVSVITIFLGGMAAGQQVVRLLRAGAADQERAEQSAKGSWKRQLRMLPPLGLTILYAYLFRKLGYVIVTPPLVGLAAWYLGYKKAPLLVAVSIGCTAVLYLLFKTFLSIPLPKSPLLGL